VLKTQICVTRPQCVKISTLPAGNYFEWGSAKQLQFLSYVIPAYALLEHMSKNVLEK